MAEPSPSVERVRRAVLPVVDPHVRIGPGGARAVASADPLAPLREWLDRARGCHLLRAVHVQGDLPWEDALADVARVQAIACTPGSGGLPNGIVACCELATSGAGERLDALVRHSNVRGVRQPTGREVPTDLAPLRRHDLLLELGGDVPIDDVERLASTWPACRLVLDETDTRGEPDDTRRSVAWQRLARHDNTVLKLGPRGLTHDPRHAVESLRTLVERALDAVGPTRVMLSSGHVGASDGGRRDDAWRALAAAAAGLSRRSRDALLRDTAVRTYRL